MLKFMEKYEASIDTVITLSVDKLEQYNLSLESRNLHSRDYEKAKQS
jgi:hypothetical protein